MKGKTRSNVAVTAGIALVLTSFVIGSAAIAGDGTQSSLGEWPTFGADYAQTRFSRLAQINKGNVHRLELKWQFHTGLAPDPVYVFSPVPLVVDGVMYLSDPGNYLTSHVTVFALDAKSGVKLWDRQIPLGSVPEARGQINVRNTRGVTYGNGRIYVAAQDAVLWALDAKTGEFVNSFGDMGQVVVGDVAAGYYLTSPAVFVPKRLVPAGGPTAGHDLLLTGIAGGENESRGFMSAYDANTGELLWRFFTVPAPDQFGGDTWPAVASGDFANPFVRGGAAPWMPPAYDEELGLVIFSTGNAGPDFDGTHRAGANLFSSSIVAVDVRTGHRVWHFQEVHHDLWDYDQAAPPVLFEVKHDGRPVKAVGAAGKTGWFYILDRRTGKPLIPCPERNVPTATSIPGEHISPTQPFCESDSFVPQGGRTLASGEYVAPIFTPPGAPGKQTGPYLFPFLVPPLPIVPVYDQLVEPGATGGSDWGPTSFNPHLGLAYIQGTVLPMRYTSNPEAAPTPGVGSIGGWWSFTAQEQGLSTATFSAMDVATGKIRWQVNVNGPFGAYGGSCATAGNLVFFGESEYNPASPAFPLVYFTAHDAQTGESLFRYRIPGDAGIAAPCITYAVGGKQYVVVAAGGGLGQLNKGDGIYVFGLPGK
jgi:quinohemoprotein ethanol dehydrogenase